MEVYKEISIMQFRLEELEEKYVSRTWPPDIYGLAGVDMVALLSCLAID